MDHDFLAFVQSACPDKILILSFAVYAVIFDLPSHLSRVRERYNIPVPVNNKIKGILSVAPASAYFFEQSFIYAHYNYTDLFIAVVIVDNLPADMKKIIIGIRHGCRFFRWQEAYVVRL